uniref:Uncharacterized protein n=1 Tax=Solanum tuberosum TaxID=4113 RepID=M1DF38_SOLTU
MAIDESTSTAATNVTGGGPNLIDSNNSLYLHPSDNPGATLVPIPFDGGGNVHGTPVDSLFNEGDNQMKKDTVDNVSLSREQYHNVMTMLHHFQVSNAGAFADSPNMDNGSVNFVGPFNEEASGDCSLIPLNPHLDYEDTYVLVPYSNDHDSVSVMDTRSSLDTALQPDVNDLIVHAVEDPVFTRKSSRTHKAPAYLNDYH